jgi:hypothetical protein
MVKDGSDSVPIYQITAPSFVLLLHLSGAYRTIVEQYVRPLGQP